MFFLLALLKITAEKKKRVAQREKKIGILKSLIKFMLQILKQNIQWNSQVPMFALNTALSPLRRLMYWAWTGEWC